MLSTAHAPRASTADPTEGARRMRELTGSLAELAEEVGCSRQTIANWRTGTKVPDAHYRALIDGAWGIPSDAWAVAPHSPVRNGSPSTATAAPSSNGHAEPVTLGPTPSTLEGCLELLGLLRTERGREGLLPAERVKLADTEARILALRHRLEKEHELLEDRIVREHPRWLMLRRTLVKVLAAYPEAAQAVAAALSEFDYPTARSDAEQPVGSAVGRSAVHAL